MSEFWRIVASNTLIVTIDGLGRGPVGLRLEASARPASALAAGARQALASSDFHDSDRVARRRSDDRTRHA